MLRQARTRKPGARSSNQAARLAATRRSRSHFRAWAERLEDRTVMATLDLVANQLIYTAGPSIANSLTISTSGPTGSYTLSDVEPMILSSSALAAGWSYNNIFLDSVSGPDASVHSMSINLLDLGNHIDIQSIGCDATIGTISLLDTINVEGDGIRQGATVSVESTPVTSFPSFGTFNFDGLPGTASIDDTGRVSRYQVDDRGAFVDRSGKFSLGDPNMVLAGVPTGGLTVGVNTLGTSTSPLSVTTAIARSLFPGFTMITSVNPTGTFLSRGFDLSLLNRIDVGGSGADDTVTVDFGNGDPLPINGLTFDGGSGGNDTLNLQGSGVTFLSESIHATGPGAGTIEYQLPNGSKSIRFSHLTPINDTVPAASLFVTTPLAAENVDVVPGPTIGPFQTMVVSGPGNPFELVRFANKTVFDLTTTGNTGVVRVDTTIPATGLTTLNVLSQSGQSSVEYQAGSPTGVYTLDAASGVGMLSDGTVMTQLFAVSGLKIISQLVPPGALTVNGTIGNDDFVVTETSANRGDLAVTLGKLPVLATGFAHYSLSGDGAGIDSVRVVGSHGPETAIYNDGFVALGGLTVAAATDVPNVSIDLPGGPANHLTFATGLSGLLYRALVGDQQDAAAFQIYTDSTAGTLLKTVRVTGVVTASFPAGQNLEVWGTSAANHFYMSDLTGYVRANSGPYLDYTPFASVRLFGGGFAGDRLDYEANLTGPGSYTFTPGYHPTLATPSTSINIDGIESIGIYGPGAAGALTIAAIPSSGSQGTAAAYEANVTGPGQGDLTAAFNQPTTYSLDAHGFGRYDLGGSSVSGSSLVVTGSATGGTASYSGSSLTVDGLLLNLAPNVQALTVNLQSVPSSHLTIAATGATQTFRFQEDDSQYNASLEIFASPASPPPAALRTLQLQGVESVGFSGVGAGNVLELRGTSGINHFSMSDITGYVRAANGSYLGFTPFSTVNLFGGGYAADRLDYEANQTSAYTVTGGYHPTLTVPLPGNPVTVALDGIESMGMFGPGSAGILRVLGVPSGGGQGGAINYQVAVTGPSQGSLDAAFNQPTLYTLHAEGFGEYGLGGSGSGLNTAAVVGTWGNDTASYNGAQLVVNGLKVSADPAIALSLDMLGGFNTVTLSGAGATDAYSIAPATGGSVVGPLVATIGSLRPIQLASTDRIVVVPSGPGNSLSVTGDAGDNAISMNDQTVRFGQGPSVNFAGIGTVNLFGAGGFDTLTYNGNNASYSFDPRTFTQGILATTGLTTTFHNVSAFHFLGSATPTSFRLLEAPTATVTVQLQYPPASGYLSTVMQAMTIVAEGVRNFTLVPSWGENTVNLEGTPGTDTVTSSGSIVTINGVGVDLGAGTTRLNVNTHDGDDSIILPLTLSGLTVYVNSGDQNDNVSMAGATVTSILETGKGFSAIRGGDGPTTILAGGGLNHIYIGGGSTLVMGRDGQNTIFGGTGRSVIITGKNYAQVKGGTGGKFVVTGTTSYDHFLPALDRVLAEWSSSASYRVRVRHILNGTGPILGGVQLQVGRTVDLSNRKSRIVGLTGVDKILAGSTDKVIWNSPVMPIASAPVVPARSLARKVVK